MTRTRKVDPEVLEREYIYDSSSPPISYTQLADRHGLARNTVAEKGIAGGWYSKRMAFRQSLGIKVADALGEEWVKFETATREKTMELGLKVLQRFENQLEDPEFQISTRDALGWAAALHALAKDAATSSAGKEVDLIDPENVHLDPDQYRDALRQIELIESGGGNDAVDAPDLEATGTEGSGPD